MNSRRTPFDVFDEMERAFDQMRRSMWGGYDHPDRNWDAESLPEAHEHGRGSNLSVESTDEGYVVLADLPGFEREEIDLRYDDGTLHVSATHEVADGEYARSRRVRESVSVGGDVVVDGIEATYRNGVLEVHVPTETDGDDAYRIDVE